MNELLLQEVDVPVTSFLEFEQPEIPIDYSVDDKVKINCHLLKEAHDDTVYEVYATRSYSRLERRCTCCNIDGTHGLRCLMNPINKQHIHLADEQGVNMGGYPSWQLILVQKKTP